DAASTSVGCGAVTALVCVPLGLSSDDTSQHPASYQSQHHSCTLNPMSISPYPFGGAAPTCHGASCANLPPFPSNGSSPHGYFAPSMPPSAAFSHSASVGS